MQSLKVDTIVCSMISKFPGSLRKTIDMPLAVRVSLTAWVTKTNKLSTDPSARSIMKSVSRMWAEEAENLMWKKTWNITKISSVFKFQRKRYIFKILLCWLKTVEMRLHCSMSDWGLRPKEFPHWEKSITYIHTIFNEPSGSVPYLTYKYFG